MAGPRIHEIQAHITASIHSRAYNPVEPPAKSSIFRISRKERERLEIYGDALLGYKLVSFLFHEYPSASPGFISTIKAALLSNLTFCNILLKAQGYSAPTRNGFPLDKPIADDLEVMTALCYFERGPKKFEVWFFDTFMPLVSDAASLYQRDDASFDEEDRSLDHVSDSSASQTSIEQPSKKSWVEACIEAAGLDVKSVPPSCPAEPPQNSRQERPLQNRSWVEAMEVAGNTDRPTSCSWVEAMARTSDPTVSTNKDERESEDMHGKNDCLPLLEAESRKYTTRWDIRKAVKRQDSIPLLPTATTHNELSSSQIKCLPTPTSSVPPLETISDREFLEPLYGTETPVSTPLALPPFATACTILDDFWTRAETCSPMEMSPNRSPTKFILLPSPCAKLGIRNPSSPEPFALRLGLNLSGRRRSDSVSSTCSSNMAISPCSSPTKSIPFDDEPPLAPMKQGPPDILRSLTGRGLAGESDSHPSQNSSPLTYLSAGIHKENVVAQASSNFWPGQTVVFKYKQPRKPLQPIVKLD